MRSVILRGTILVPAASLLLALLALFGGAGTGAARASERVVTSDIVLLMEDSYGLGETATLALRNDGDVPYIYNQYWEACHFNYKDASGRSFKIPPAVHCDNPDATEIAPGQTVTILSGWKLDECTIPGFFCYATRPLPSGDYTISGSLRSADGAKRADFSKTISITGPRFTTDISIQFGVVVSDPPTGEMPVVIDLFNSGTMAYVVPEPCWFLLFYGPDGYLFDPPSLPCDGGERTLAPGARLTVLSDWKQDECVDFNPHGCATAPLPPGDYTVKGGLWSQDGQSYAEFSGTYTIHAQTQTPSPTPSPAPPAPVVLPNGGGAPLGPAEDASQPARPPEVGGRAGAGTLGRQTGPEVDIRQPVAEREGWPGALVIGAGLVTLGALALTGMGFAARRRHSSSSINRP